MANKLTTSAQEALQSAQAEAIRRENQELRPEHLFHAFLKDETGNTATE